MPFMLPKNLQLLATEMFKTQRSHSPRFMNQIFVEKDTSYTLRSGRNILAPKPNTKRYGIENVSFLGAKIWHTIPSFLRYLCLPLQCAASCHFAKPLSSEDS